MTDAEVKAAFAEVDRLLQRGTARVEWGKRLTRAAQVFFGAAALVWLFAVVAESARLPFWALQAVGWTALTASGVLLHVDRRETRRIDALLKRLGASLQVRSLRP